MESRKSGSRLAGVIIGRFTLILVALAIVAMAIIELAVALNIEFTRTLARKAMWAGSLLWIAIAVIGWVDTFKNKNKNKNNPPLWCAALFTVIAAGSVAGLFTPIFSTFAIWVNVVLSALFGVVIVWGFPQAWKSCAVVPAES